MSLPVVPLIAQASGIAHVGLVYPCSTSYREMAEFAAFFRGLGCSVELVPSINDLDDLDAFSRLRTRYMLMGFRVMDAPEKPDADRAGSCRRLRVRHGYQDLYITFAEVRVGRAALSRWLKQLPGLHVALRFPPTHFKALVAHPARERPVTCWGQSRSVSSIFLRGPFGYEVECQIDAMAVPP